MVAEGVMVVVSVACLVKFLRCQPSKYNALAVKSSVDNTQLCLGIRRKVPLSESTFANKQMRSPKCSDKTLF